MLRRLILALVLSAAAWSTGYAAVREALVFGQQAYQPEVGPLSNTLEDAALMAKALESAGFKVTLVRNASRLTMLRETTAYAQRLKVGGTGAIGFLYYSGHGVANPDNGRNYLIPTDVASTATATLWDESVPLDELLRRVTEVAPDADAVVVFDACRDELRLPFRSGSKGLARPADTGGVLLAYSTSPGAKAADGDPDDPSGPYAAVLAAELVKGGRDVASLFEDVKFGVLQKTNQRQLPWTSNGLRRRVYLSGGPVVASPGPSDSLEATYWASIEKLDQPSLYADYLDRVAKGEFKGAFSAVAKLKATRPAATSTVPGAAPAAGDAPDSKWGFFRHMIGKRYATYNPSTKQFGSYGYRLIGADQLLLDTSDEYARTLSVTGPGRLTSRYRALGFDCSDDVEVAADTLRWISRCASTQLVQLYSLDDSGRPVIRDPSGANEPIVLYEDTPENRGVVRAETIARVDRAMKKLR